MRVERCSVTTQGGTYTDSHPCELKYGLRRVRGKMLCGMHARMADAGRLQWKKPKSKS